MKKSIFVLAALLAATFANAQITLEHTFVGFVSAPTLTQNIIGDYFVVKDKETNSINVYDGKDYSIVWTLPKPAGKKVDAWLFSSNIFSTDGKFACVVKFSDEQVNDNTKSHYYVYNEDNTIIADLGVAWDNEYVCFLKFSTGYKLLMEKVSTDYSVTTEIYSLPGNGEAQAVSSPSSPKRSARKIARDGQVLVQTDNNTYTLTGAEVK